MGSFFITLREGFEAALIVGLILAYLKKTGNLQRHASTVWWGVAGGVVASLLAGGILFASVGELEGTAEALYEGIAMLLAAAVVTWMVFWMRKQAATIGAHLRQQVGESLVAGGGLALAGVAFIGVAREGLETALFLYASTEDSGPVLAVSGALLGLVAAVVLGVLFYRGALRLDLRRFFLVTGVLVIAFASWLIFGGLHELGEAAGSELLEQAALIAALLYAAGFTLIYLRGVRRPPEPRVAPASPVAVPTDS
ncbi:MAG: FTR1 family protein [bacterium]